MWRSLKTRWCAVNAIAELAGERRSVAVLCARVGMSRQNYYAARRLRQRREIDESLIVELVRRERRVQPLALPLKPRFLTA